MNYFKEYLPSIVEWFHKDKDDLTKTEREYMQQYCVEIVQHLVATNPDLLNEPEIDHFCQKYIDKPDQINIGNIFVTVIYIFFFYLRVSQ